MQVSDYLGPAGLTGVSAILAATLTFIGGRRKARAEVESMRLANAAKAAEIANEAAGMVREHLTNLIKDQAERIDALVAEVDLLRQELSTARSAASKADSDRRAAMTRIDELHRHVEQLEAAMTANGITPPSRPTWLGGAN